MTKIVGLTGGIGSGKTTVARLFEKKGVPLFIADDEAKIVFGLPETQARLKELFGEEAFTAGTADRAKIAAIVFQNPVQLQALNTLIHPLVQRRFDMWLDRNSQAPFVIKEAAILFESGSYKDCDKIITVSAPLEIRLQRVIDRDNLSREKVMERIQNQWTDEQRSVLSDYVISNINLEETQRQIDKIFHELT